MRNLFIFILAFVLPFSTIMAQSEPEATAILKKVSAKYKSYSSIKTDYTIKIHMPESKSDIIKKGTVHLKGAKFKMQIDDVISTCDGKTIWNYLPSEKQIQISLYNKTDGNISPEKLFTFWEKDFIYRVKEKKVLNGKNVVIIEMSPTTKKNGAVFKIDLTINTATNEIISFLIYEKNGTRTTYSITTLSSNVAMDDSLFIFDPKKFPGVEVIDLR